MASLQSNILQPVQADFGDMPESDKFLANLEIKQLCQLTHSQIRHQDRKDLLLALRRVMDDPKRGFSYFQAEGIAALARYLCDWATLDKLQERGVWRTTANEVAMADIQMGRFEQALSKVDAALLSYPDDPQLHRTKQDLQHMLANFPYHAEDLINGPISLTPLSFNHAADFGWQYADASIAELCNLPKFESTQHWLQWLRICQKEKARRLFAVMHQEYGFVGSVSLQVFNGTGFFYYWLGADFQGQGLGPKAVDLLMQIGRRYLGMESCYAKVFNFNKPSQKAITKLGFQRLPFAAKPPSEAEIFYYQGKYQEPNKMFAELSQLLIQMNSGILLVKLGINTEV